MSCDEEIVYGWGSGPWGSLAWGDGFVGGLQLVRAFAVRDNAIRLQFDDAVYLSFLFDVPDAATPGKYNIAPIGTTDENGDPIRAVNVVGVERVTDETDPARFIDLILDRPMSAYPAKYSVEARDVYSADLGRILVQQCAEFDGLVAAYLPPSLEAGVPSRDIANPQGLASAVQATQDNGTTAALSLGTFAVDEAGDYAFDEGMQSYRKRVVRRLMTRANGFAHLPGYGVGVPEQMKKLATPARLASLATSAKVQIAREPETASVNVQLVPDTNSPGLTRLRTTVQTRAGRTQRFDIPIG